ncbi:MAG: DUF5667 domain-containing protein [Candidatus Aenigmarchaeota archaeon]|nr:DUF5667 domain-containing protein [Candidatus Aenigmarchaeota archaeon]
MEQEIPISKDVMKAISEETRTNILKALENRPMTASELSRALGKHVTTVCEHMGMLEASKLVERNCRPGRKWVYYRLTKRADEILHPKHYYKYVVMLSVAMLLLTGTFVSSANSMPGDVLYPVKRGVEGMRMLAAADSSQRALVHLQIADERLNEAKAAAAKNDTAVMSSMAADYRRELDSARQDADKATEAMANSTDDRARSALEAVDESTARHITMLENIMRRPHGAAGEDIDSVLNHTRAVHDSVDSELSGRPGQPGHDDG